MLGQGQHLRLLAEAEAGDGIASQPRTQNLDGEPARPSNVAGDVNLAHAAYSSSLQNPIRSTQQGTGAQAAWPVACHHRGSLLPSPSQGDCQARRPINNASPKRRENHRLPEVVTASVPCSSGLQQPCRRWCRVRRRPPCSTTPPKARTEGKRPQITVIPSFGVVVDEMACMSAKEALSQHPFENCTGIAFI
jgi:hypothetical protein